MVIFTKDWSAPDPISEGARKIVDELLVSGRLHRYQGGTKYVSEAEVEIAKYLGVKFCLGLNSGGCAIFLALKLSGVSHGTPVLTNSYTLAPVPGAIRHAGGVPALVECSSTSFQLDMTSLREQQKATGAKHLLLCYMRGKLPDVDAIIEFCKETGVTLIEDCAHVMGSYWRGKPLGTFGTFGCYSTQTNKLINSGEGGFLATNSEELISKAIIHSGSYGHFYQHSSRPEDTSLLLSEHEFCPNFSLRMTNLAAVLILDQIPNLPNKVNLFNKHYEILEHNLGKCEHFVFPGRQPEESYVGTSFQFRLKTSDYTMLQQYQRNTLARGVKLAWFGCDDVAGFTSTHKHWQYVPSGDLSQTDLLLHNLFDLPLYHTMSWSDDDFHTISEIIIEEAEKIFDK